MSASAAFSSRGSLPHLTQIQLIPGMADGAVGQELRQPARNSAQHVVQRCRGAAADHRRRQVGWAIGEKPVQRVPRHEPSLQQRREPCPRPCRTELREHERDVGIRPGLRGEYPQRSIQRVVDESRHFGLVRHVEPRIEVRFERELAEQRQAERVDRADRDLAEAIAQVEPARLVELRSLGGVAQLAHDPLAHLRGGLPCEGNRQDVGRLDPCLQKIDVPRHEHRGLPGTGRGFEHDVVRGIDGKRARVGVHVETWPRRRCRQRTLRHGGASSSKSGSCSVIAHVVLPADGGEPATRAEPRLVRLRRERSALDAGHCAEKPLLAVRQRLLERRSARRAPRTSSSPGTRRSPRVDSVHDRP